MKPKISDKRPHIVMVNGQDQASWLNVTDLNKIKNPTIDKLTTAIMQRVPVSQHDHELIICKANVIASVHNDNGICQFIVIFSANDGGENLTPTSL